MRRRVSCLKRNVDRINITVSNIAMINISPSGECTDSSREPRVDQILENIDRIGQWVVSNYGGEPFWQK